MIDHETLERALRGVQDLVRADGGDLVVAGVGTDSVDLLLILEDAECRECVMPGVFLERVALDMLAPTVAGLRAVHVRDPRA